MAFGLLTFGIAVAKVTTGGVLPIPSSFPLSIEKILEVGMVWDELSGTGSHIMTFSEVALESSEQLGAAVRTHPFLFLLLDNCH